MGVCGSSSADNKAEFAKSKKIDGSLRKDQQREMLVHKLLLLGSGESGKSTLYKQMITLYGKGFTEDERRGYVSIVWKNVIEAMRTLSTQSKETALSTPELEASRTLFSEMKDEEELTPALGEQVAALWKEAAIRAVYDKRASFQLPDSASYFFDNVTRLAVKSFVPTNDDILRARVRTTGIVESKFEVEGNKFQIYDVGGQRNERKKWIHCFENVTAVLFVVAISEYDQTCFEDETTNRIAEAMALFDEIANNAFFKNSAMILFLNKRDLFATKIPNVPLRVCFPDFTGGNTYEEATAYIQSQFEAKQKNKTKPIYTHVTCATDKNNVNAVFNAVKDIVIRQSLAEGGLVGM